MSPHDITRMFLALGVLLGAARILGELARRYRQPAVLGEIVAGILLGRTVLGRFAPGLEDALFATSGPTSIAVQAITTVSVVLFLLVAGLEVDLSTIFRLRHSAVVIAVCSLVLPFGLGFAAARIAPVFFGMEPGAHVTIFALYLGIALSICALPVIVKTLMDLNLFRTNLGMIVIAVAVCHDLVGWIGFAILLGMMHSTAEAGGIATTVALTLAFALGVLTVGRWLIDRALPWIQAHSSWPAGVLGFAVTLGLLGAAATERIGIHAIFGAFIVGIALGDSRHLEERTREIIAEFIGGVFAPIFFASIGLRVDFAAHFDLRLAAALLLLACISQTLGSMLGARWTGSPPRQAWAIGIALNARGAMEIVLALLALQHGLIGERLFVGLVVVALVTSMMAGPLIQRILGRRRPSPDNAPVLEAIRTPDAGNGPPPRVY